MNVGPPMLDAAAANASAANAPVANGAPVNAPVPASIRRLRVRHANHYDYAQPVGRSVHQLQLCPVHDRRQTLVSHNLQIDPAATTHDYEDVFGNWSTRFELTQPYSKLSITAESVVELLDIDPFAFALVDKRRCFR